MALANSAIQEVDGMKSLAIGSHHHHHNENPNNGNLVFRNTTTSYQLEQQQQQQIIMSSLSSSSSRSLINFKCGINFHKNSHESNLLSFEPQGICTQDAYNWDDDDHDDQQQRLMDDPNCFQTATNNYNTTPPKDHTKNEDHHHHHSGSVYEWLYSQATDNDVSDAIQDPQAAHHQIIIANHKRSHIGESSGGVCKKQCTAAAKKQKPKSATAKDPQSIAAKNRRERISERLKILQELVPNGSKVDLVTMLEKAISYVKFLQLQVKILATDEFWPVQGGKAPDISQVKEAIDVILSSQRERSSSSNSEK